MSNLKIPLGRFDNPEKQEQKDYYVDLYHSNLAVFGSSMSGKTVLIKTLLLHMHYVLKLTDKEEIYILDFGNGLKDYNDLPFVAGYFSAANEESVRRIFKILNDKLNENARCLSSNIYSEVEESNRPSHVTFVLDGFSSFVSEERYLIYQDMLKKLAREGLSKGLTVVIAGSDTKGFNQISASFKRIIAFDLPKDSYSDLYSGKVEKPLILSGRGTANDDLSVYEFQAYLPWDFSNFKSNENMNEKNLLRYLRKKILFWGLEYETPILDEMKEETDLLNDLLSLDSNKGKQNKVIYDKLMSRKVNMLPEEHLTSENWNKYCEFSFENCNGDFVAGLDYYSLKPIPSITPSTLNLKNAQTIAIYGKKEFGKSNLLKLLIEAANRISDTHFCFWEDGRRALSNPKGLERLIGNLKHKKIVYNKEEFLSYLYENRYLFEKKERVSQTDDITCEIEREIKNNLKNEFYVCKEEIESWYRKARNILLENDNQEQLQELEENFKEKIENEKNRIEKKYINILEDRKKSSVLDTNYGEPDSCSYLTVFVVQSRMFYQEYYGDERDYLISKISSMIEKSSSPVLFIFSDVQRIENRDFQTLFNNSVRYAFLLDDIVRFINIKGQRSVFGNQDTSELKESFGSCELGDGFFYDIDRDYISKLKFIHSFPDEIT